MIIALSSASFQVACDLVQPVARKLPEEALFDLVDRIEQALDEAINPPAFMNGAAAARYVRRRFDIPLTRKGGPRYRRLGPQYVFARDDLDVWAQRRIASAPAVAVVGPTENPHTGLSPIAPQVKGNIVRATPTGQPATVSQPTASTPGAPATRTEHVGVMMVNTLRFPDRAAVVTVAVLQMVATTPQQELQRALENYLRDEFSDTGRQTLADREPADE